MHPFLSSACREAATRCCRFKKEITFSITLSLQDDTCLLVKRAANWEFINWRVGSCWLVQSSDRGKPKPGEKRYTLQQLGTLYGHYVSFSAKSDSHNFQSGYVFTSVILNRLPQSSSFTKALTGDIANSSCKTIPVVLPERILRLRNHLTEVKKLVNIG